MYAQKNRYPFTGSIVQGSKVQLVLTSVSLPIFRKYGGASDYINLTPGNLSNPFSRFPAIGFIVTVTLCSQPMKLPAILKAGLITIYKLVNRQPGTLNLFQP